MGSVMSRPVRRVRRAVTETLLLVDVVTVIFSAVHLQGSLRFVVALIFGLVVPGWSVVGFLKIRDVALLISLSIATSLSVEMVLGEAMLAWWWHLQIFELILGIVCASLLVLQLRIPARVTEGSRQ
jgi:archaellum biogenesis protein FlaJ (TadC family)